MEVLKLSPDARLEPAPEPAAFDYGLMIAKVAALAFPHCLGPAVGFFDLLTAPARGRRMNEWCEELRLRLNELSQKVNRLTPEALAKDEAFFSAFAQATQAALRTHQQEKLAALKNAVINAALGHEPDADRQQQFVALVDRFADKHLVLLHFFKDPARFFQAKGKPVPEVPFSSQEFPRKLLVYDLVQDAMPQLIHSLQSTIAQRTAAPYQFIELVLQDLVSAKLIALERHKETWAVPKFDANRQPTPVRPLITHLGEEFLSFISEPEAGQ